MADRFRDSQAVIFIGITATAFGFCLGLIKDFKEVWYRSDALELAEDSAKSKFSDEFVKLAYERMFLSRLFAKRVQDSAPAQNIEKSWDEYISILRRWNTNLMINIVGLETYYNTSKSIYFEIQIQNDFANIDSALREVYLSPYVRHVLHNPGNAPDSADKGDILRVFKTIDDANGDIYWFVRCFKKPTNDGVALRACNLSPQISN